MQRVRGSGISGGNNGGINNPGGGGDDPGAGADPGNGGNPGGGGNDPGDGGGDDPDPNDPGEPEGPSNEELEQAFTDYFNECETHGHESFEEVIDCVKDYIEENLYGKEISANTRVMQTFSEWDYPTTVIDVEVLDVNNGRNIDTEYAIGFETVSAENITTHPEYAKLRKTALFLTNRNCWVK